MRTTRAAIAAAVLTGLALAACGGDDDDDTATTEAGAGTEATAAPDTAAPAGTDAPETSASAETTAAAGTDTTAAAGGDEALIFGIPSPLASEPGEHNINLGITCYADQTGGEVITLDSELDVNQQITDFDSLLAQGADVLPFLPLDPNAFEGPFERAAEAGAVVVELYNPASTAPGAVYENSRGAGEDAVVLVAEAFPDGANALVIGGPPIPAVLERTGGFADNAEANGITVVGQADNLNDNVNDARTLVDDLLTQYPDVDVVFGFNDNSAIGAGLAAESRGLDLMIFGINGTPEGIEAVLNGTITATYDADQWGMGFQAAEIGARILAGETVEPVALDFIRWDESNASEWVPADDRCEAES